MKKICANPECDVSFTTTNLKKIYHSCKCAKRAKNLKAIEYYHNNNTDHHKKSRNEKLRVKRHEKWKAKNNKKICANPECGIIFKPENLKGSASRLYHSIKCRNRINYIRCGRTPYNSEQYKKEIVLMSDTYIKQLIARENPDIYKDIPPIYIILKRKNLTLKRAIKEGDSNEINKASADLAQIIKQLQKEEITV